MLAQLTQFFFFLTKKKLHQNIPVVVVCNKTDVCNINAREIGGSPLPSNVSVAEWVSDKVCLNSELNQHL